MQDLITAEWNDAVTAMERCYELGWTDGLPVVPPTLERVEEFMDFAERSPDEVLGSIPERRREVTVAKTAANAVMAGCLPEYFPVVLAATEAMLDPEFNLIAPSSSQGGAAVLVVVNGPAVGELGMNSGANIFGPGNRANATIGRAIRLILMNACASIPGLFDRTVIGHPGKYTYCIAENETGLGLAAVARRARLLAGRKRCNRLRVVGAETGTLRVPLAGSGAGHRSRRRLRPRIVPRVVRLGRRRIHARPPGTAGGNHRRRGRLLGNVDEARRAGVPAPPHRPFHSRSQDSPRPRRPRKPRRTTRPSPTSSPNPTTSS